jgi:hypothetical protein
MKRLSLAMSLAASMWACNGGSPTSPTNPILPTEPRATYTLSGVVSEVTPTGQVPLEDVTVLEAYSQVKVKTDTNGLYSLTGFHAGDRAYQVFSKEGYQNVESDASMTVIGNSRVDVQLVRR